VRALFADSRSVVATGRRPTKTEGRVVKPFLSRLVAATSSTCVLFFPGGFALLLLGVNRSAYAWAILVSLCLVVFGFALVRIHCVVSDEGLRVVNFWRTYDIAWRDFSRVELAYFWLGPGILASSFAPLRIRARDGLTIIVQASLADPLSFAEDIGVRVDQ
jgi:hypothetical protein